jgi:hypothetical protein
MYLPLPGVPSSALDVVDSLDIRGRWKYAGLERDGVLQSAHQGGRVQGSPILEVDGLPKAALEWYSSEDCEWPLALFWQAHSWAGGEDTPC